MSFAATGEDLCWIDWIDGYGRDIAPFIALGNGEMGEAKKKNEAGELVGFCHEIAGFDREGSGQKKAADRVTGGKEYLCSNFA